MRGVFIFFCGLLFLGDGMMSLDLGASTVLRQEGSVRFGAGLFPENLQDGDMQLLREVSSVLLFVVDQYLFEIFLGEQHASPHEEK